VSSQISPSPLRRVSQLNLTGRIFLKLIGVFVCLLLIAVLSVDIVASRVVETGYVRTLREELTGKARLVAIEAERSFSFSEGNAPAVAAAAGARLTLVDSSGRVLIDTGADAGHMENHRQRPEFAAALNGQDGWTIRRSPTVGVKFLYVAVPMHDGAIRLAVPLSEIEARVAEIRGQAFGAIALSFVPAMLVAALFSRHVSAKLGKVIDFAGELARGNFQARLAPVGRDELGILSTKLNDTGEKLQEMFEQLQREHTELEKLERVRKDFVINVSHELRTPLASISGYAETLLDGAMDDPRHNRRFLEIIRQNAERLTTLTSDLLTLSRIELKTHAFQFGSYYVNALLSDARDFIQPIAAKKNIPVSCNLAPEGTEVFCDSEAVHQMLSNLLDNAVKYTREGGSIIVGAHVLGGPGQMERVEIYVEDTGMGVPVDDLPRLFERFYRVDKARSRELGGTGLGLAIVKHLALSQGGEVYVQSEVNRGSTFAFTLPVRDLGLDPAEALHSEFMTP
jgi:two-component system, OmpR family, phosphate regulon sensor histidine kinase PhoR